jgi:hypothetical protein
MMLTSQAGVPVDLGQLVLQLVKQADLHEAATRRIEDKLDKQDEKLDRQDGKIDELSKEVRSSISEHDKNLELHSLRLATVEERVKKTEHEVTTTGQHRIAQAEDSRRMWVKWALGLLGTMMAAGLGALVSMAMRR